MKPVMNGRLSPVQATRSARPLHRSRVEAATAANARQHLEARAHAVRRQESRDTAFDLTGSFRVRGHQSRGSLDDAERAEELGLHDGAIERQPGAVQRRGEIVKIDVDRQVGFARRGQRQLVSVAANRLQRVAGRRGRVTVVDNQQRNRARRAKS